MKSYKIRKFQNGKNSKGEPFVNYSLTIPSAIAEALPNDVQFACELTDEGILFKPAQAEAEQVQLPAWAQQAAATNGTVGDAPVEATPEAPAAAETTPEAPAEAPKPKGRTRPGAKVKATA